MRSYSEHRSLDNSISNAEAESQVKVRLLRNIIFLIVPLMWLTIVLSAFVISKFDLADAMIVAILSGVFLFIAAICHKIGSRLGSILIITLYSVGAYFAAYPESSTLDVFILASLSIPVLIANTFLTLRESIVLGLSHTVCISAYGYGYSMTFGLSLTDALVGPLSLFLSITMVLMLISHATRQIEKMRADSISEKEIRLRTIIETMKDAVIVTDTQTNINYVSSSAARLFGVAEETLLGRPISVWMSQIVPSDLDEIKSKLHLVSSHSNSTRVEYGYNLNRQTPLYVETIVSMIRDANKLPVGTIYVSRDISDRKRIELENLQSGIERERSSLMRLFVNDMSHDLRTPLAVMGTSIYLIRRKLAEADQAKISNQLDTIATQILHLEKQADNLSSLTRLTQSSDTPGEAKYRFENQPINPIIKDVLEEFERRFEEKGIALQVAFGHQSPRAMISESELRQALRHLAANALQYTPTKGEVVVGTLMLDQQLIIEFADTGIGIEPEHVKHIFNPFYRVDKARTLESGGMGLGLSITRAIIQAHAGVLEVESKLGVGSTFRIRLPLVNEPAQFYPFDAPTVANPKFKT
jgi:PAS domain S-box-containing protein